MVSPRYRHSSLRLFSTAAACASTIVTLEQMSKNVSAAVKLMPSWGSPGWCHFVLAPRRMP